MLLLPFVRQHEYSLVRSDKVIVRRLRIVKNIRVSVIMPSLNVSAYIEECIKSAIRQTLADIEIICIDAGSADGTYEILKKYEKLDNRIKVISFGVKSYGAQVNHGISVSQGEYVAILETDDFVGPKMYETLYHAAEQYHVDCAKADYKKFFALANGEYLYSVIKQFERCRSLWETFRSPYF